MVNCRNCGKANPPGSRFCLDCGTGLPIESVPRGALRGRLVLVRPDGSEGGAHPLFDGINVVGRGSGPLFDADSFLSPVHLRCEIGGGRFVIRDAGSLNGVFLKLSEEEPLFDGAVLRIGQELLRFDPMRPPKLLPDGTEIMGSPHPGYWGRLTMIIGRAQDGKIIEGTSFPLVGEAVVIGRERGDILFSEDGYVSGTHARFSYRQGRPFLQDLASSNGTYLRIPAERAVTPGTFLLLGQQLFRLMQA